MYLTATCLCDGSRTYFELTSEEQPLASFGSYGKAPGQFIWPHTIAIAPDGALYIGEVGTGMRIQKFIK